VPGLAFVHLTQRDVVRAKIVADIVSAYERADDVNGSARGDGGRANRGGGRPSRAGRGAHGGDTDGG
jgi:hypothetical protein